MKYIRHISRVLPFLCALCMASCVQEIFEPQIPDYGAVEDGDYVTLNLSVEMMVEPEQAVWTKALGEVPEVKDLYVAVFDTGDILTEIVKAVPGTVDDPRDVFEPGTEGNNYLTRFHVTLTKTAESREVQFIAIGKKDFIDIDDFDMVDEASFIKKFIVTDNVDAYWCRKHFDGISAASSAGMQNLKMIRNFLKVQVSDHADNFELQGFYVFNKPRYGTLAPYNPNTAEYIWPNSSAEYASGVNFDRFANYAAIDGVQNDDDNMAYKQLVETQKYVGYMPSTVEYITMEELANGAADLDSWFNSIMIGADGFDYLYECTHTDADNPYIIFKGVYSGAGASGNPTYYKADFVYQKDEFSDKVYFHLLRNFYYELRIAKVYGDGAESLEVAVNSPAMNNFDGSAQAQSYTVISKDTERLYISSTDMLVTSGTSVKVYLKNMGGNDFAEVRNTQVSISRITPCINVKDVNQSMRLTPLIKYNNPGGYASDDAAYQAAIEAADFDPEAPAYIGNYVITRNPALNAQNPQYVTYNGSSGWVEYTITLAKNPKDLGDNEMWQQKITFTNGAGNLTRTLTLSALKPYEFSVDAQDYVPGNEGETMTVDIILPSGISEARFPLKFLIEPDAHTLYPDATNANYPILPVSSGPSMIPNKTGQSYWFTRTITYEEYAAASEDIQSNKSFPSYFKTLVAASATSVYVKADVSSPYFVDDAAHPKSDSFVNALTTGSIVFEKEPLYVAVGSKAFNPITVNSGAPVTYSVQNVAVATVNATTGEVIGVSEGETIVTATIPQYKAYTGATKTFTVKVAERLPEVWQFEWSGLLTPVVNVGKTVTTNTAIAHVSPTTTDPGTNPPITYTSSDTNVATVDANGHVTGVNPGTVTITAHTEIAEFVHEGHTYSAMSENIRYTIQVVAVGVTPLPNTEFINVPFYDGKMMWFTKTHTGYDAWNFRADDVRYGMQASAWDSSASMSRNSDSWLISPVLDLRAAINPVLEFNHTGNYWTDGYTGDGTYGEDGTVYVPALSENAGNLAQAKVRMMQDALVLISFDGGTNWQSVGLTADEYPTGYNWVSVNVSHSLKTLLQGKTDAQLQNVRIAFEYKASPETKPDGHPENYRPWAGTWQVKSFRVVELPQ